MGRTISGAMALLFPALVFAQLTLSRPISDGLVMQRNTEFPVWGLAAVGEEVTIAFMDRKVRVKANGEGEWEAMVETGPAGGPYDLRITTATASKTVRNVLVGDVYLCSGQSNMELPMQRVEPLYEQEVASAHYDEIRYFEVPKEYDFQGPRQELSGGSWISVDSGTIGGISAVPYFFAKEIHLDEGVPIGIINASLGGSPIEAWLDEKVLEAFPLAHAEVLKYRDSSYLDSIEASDRQRALSWYKELNTLDVGLEGNWKQGNHGQEWQTMQVPGYWAKSGLGAINGSMWFAKSVEVPQHAVGKSADLELGRIVDADSVFINGTFIGNTTYQYPPRRYKVPEGVLQRENQVVVRIINEIGEGGFVKDKAYVLRLSDTLIDLKGDWRYRIGAQMPALRPQTFVRWKPTGLYNAMIHPLVRYPISGILWYQGESNVDNAEQYDTLIKLLVRDWRQKWGGDKIPFLLVQLANFLTASPQPQESNWALMRESQAAVLDLDATAMAVTLDVGEWNDIHPLNKKAVGHRLALGAKKLVYGRDVVHRGPTFILQELKGNSLKIHFDLFGSELVVKGNSPQGFSIAGEDGKFYWAEGEVDGNTVLLRSEEVPRPVFVRYAWADNPDRANLFNTEGLPAVPFRTDKSAE
ncbi:MAG: sialate O-acetylesterase [Sediminicola sp.]